MGLWGDTIFNNPISLAGGIYLDNYSQTEVRIRNYDYTANIFTHESLILKNSSWAFIETLLVSPPLYIPSNAITIGQTGHSNTYSFTYDQLVDPTVSSIDELIRTLNGWFNFGGVPISVNGGTLISGLAGINFIEGANITINVAQNLTTNLTDVTISALGGGGGFSYTTVAVNTTPYAVLPITGWYMYLVDATAGNIVINFPTAVGNNAVYTVKKVDASANTVTLTPNGAETIDGAATKIIRFQNTSVDIYSDNANLYIM